MEEPISPEQEEAQKRFYEALGLVFEMSQKMLLRSQILNRAPKFPPGGRMFPNADLAIIPDPGKVAHVESIFLRLHRDKWVTVTLDEVKAESKQFTMPEVLDMLPKFPPIDWALHVPPTKNDE